MIQEQFQTSASVMLKGMQDLEEFCDVTLVSEDGYRIRAHKVVLASASTILRDTIQSNEENNEYQVVHMNAVKSRLMKAIVDLIYKGETLVNQRNCEEFLDILNHYRIVKENSKVKRTKRSCRYHNRGFCKKGLDFQHNEDDMAGIHCEERTCSKRHCKICKFWDSRYGCFRKSKCQYLHDDPKSNKNTMRKYSNEKCDSCKFDHYGKDQVNIHMIKNHRFKLCLQCDDTIKNKEILLKKTFCLK